ncbi:hypothetical protein DXG01_011689 [Tephrocybe rancida]|nr:hypothetical protein DXG01_011689 [Tephrocybe rancida]
MSTSITLHLLPRASRLSSTRTAVSGVRRLHASSRRSEKYAKADLAVRFISCCAEDIMLRVVGVEDRLVLVDFYAEYVTFISSILTPELMPAFSDLDSWCGPCHQLSPILEKFATDASVATGTGLPVDLVKIDTENKELLPLAQKYKVRALPTVIAFHNGEPVNQFVGALNEAGVKQFLRTV